MTYAHLCPIVIIIISTTFSLTLSLHFALPARTPFDATRMTDRLRIKQNQHQKEQIESELVRVGEKTHTHTASQRKKKPKTGVVVADVDT